MKKFIAALLSVVLMMALATGAFAASNDTVVEVKEQGITVTLPGSWYTADRNSKADNYILKYWGESPSEFKEYCENYKIWFEALSDDLEEYITMYVYAGQAQYYGGNDWKGKNLEDLEDVVAEWTEVFSDEDYDAWYDTSAVVRDDATFLIIDLYYEDSEMYGRDILTMYDGTMYYMYLSGFDHYEGMIGEWNSIPYNISFSKPKASASGAGRPWFAIGGGIVFLFIVAILLQAKSKKKKTAMATDMGYTGSNTYTSNTGYADNTYTPAPDYNSNIYTSARPTAEPGEYTENNSDDGGVSF